MVQVYAVEDTPRRPADHQATVRRMFFTFWSHGSSFLIPCQLKQLPQPSIPETRLSPLEGTCDLDITMHHMCIFGCLDILVWFTRYEQWAWPTHPPHSSSLPSKKKHLSTSHRICLLNTHHHAFFRYPGHHLSLPLLALPQVRTQWDWFTYNICAMQRVESILFLLL